MGPDRQRSFVEWHEPWNHPFMSPFSWRFRFEHRPLLGGMDYWMAQVPLWGLAVAVAVPGAILWYRHRRHRFGPGRCPKCGYELAGLAEGAGCPECGIRSG